MPTAVLLGVPQGYIAQIQSAYEADEAKPAAWSLLFVPSRDRKFPSFFDSEIWQAMQFAQRAPGGAHIMGYSTQSDRPSLARKIKPYFRFRWSSAESLKKIGGRTSDYLQELFRELREESDWIEAVKPRDVRSASLLPQTSFMPERSVEDMWRHIESYGPGNIQSAVAALAKFQRLHWRKVAPEAHIPAKYLWVDSKERCFDHSQDRHGTPAFPSNWKYSFEIVEGFHYDVRHQEGRQFQLSDSKGEIHTVTRNSYINVDPHGAVRKATPQ